MNQPTGGGGKHTREKMSGSDIALVQVADEDVHSFGEEDVAPVQWSQRKILGRIGLEFDNTAAFLRDNTSGQPENQAELLRIQREFKQLLRSIEDCGGGKRAYGSQPILNLLSIRRRKHIG